MDLYVRAGFTIPDTELHLRFTPSGGPGGQHANRSNTRVELTWDVAASEAVDARTRTRLVDRLGPTVRVVVDDERSQARNRSIAQERLVARLQVALHEPRKRRPTRPSRSAKRKRVDQKKQRGELKQSRRRPGMDQ
ncbi:MAG: alternative ribosome rescue aminoacyl-tRNA hydrolase ArfB [Acidimicrobiales bacterium]